MLWGLISNGDSLFRPAVHPLAFRNKRFHRLQYFKMYTMLDGSLQTSVVWEKLAPASRFVHGFGCRLARKMNTEQIVKQKDPDRIYCGFYEFPTQLVRSLPDMDGLEELASSDAIHAVEGDEIAHANFIVILKSTALDLEGTKTAIIDRIWNGCHGPATHCCECDLGVINHPMSLLPVPPLGKYEDKRTRTTRMLHILRFQLYKLAFTGRARLKRIGLMFAKTEVP